MGPVASAVGAVSGVVGGINGKNQQNADNAAGQQAAAAQQQIAQQLQNNITNQTNQYNSSYAPALAPLSSGINSEGNVASGDVGNLASMLLQAGMDPSTISQLTGVDASQITGNTLNYLQNTGGTNLAGATPGASSFFQGEMQNGINPQYAQNAQNQIQQGLNQETQNAMAHAQPGQNVNALVKDLNNQALTQQTNLAGNLAGQNQQIMSQGAQGLLGAASGLDSQKAGMLQNAATGAQNFNQQAFGNLGTSTASAQGILSALQQFLGQGQSGVNSANSSLAGLMGNYQNAQNSAAQAAGAAGQGANGAFGSAANSLAGLFPMSSSASPLAASPGAVSGIGPVANGAQYAANVGQPQSQEYTPLANAPMVSAASSPLSTSTPTNGMFNPGLFTQQLSGQSYTAGQNYTA